MAIHKDIIAQVITEKNWLITLREFRSTYDDVFKQFGFTFAEAWMCWQINMLRNDIGDIETLLKEEEESP